MKILVITNNPDRASFRQRIAVHVDNLRAGGINCELEKLPPGLLSRRWLFMKAKDFDGVFLHKKILNPFDAYYLRKYAKKIIYDFDDAVMFDDKNPERAHRKRQNSFRRTVQLVDLVVAGNKYLAEHARKFNPDVEILPTGLDTTAYQLPRPVSSDDKIRLVWIGSRPTLPHLRQISLALEEIGKRFSNVVLRIICDEFFDLQNMKVEKRLWSQQTEIPDLVSSDIGLSPLSDNAFTRGKCGFKILQYAAAGLPTVASPVGVNAEYVIDGAAGFHSRDSRQWIDKIGLLLSDAGLRKQMGQKARLNAEQYDIRIIGRQLANLIKQCIESGPV